MDAREAVAAGLALSVAGIAALNDWRRGEIPNWLTLPAIVAAPIGYGFGFGAEHALRSLTAGALSGLVPYLLFRRGAMGGGDVKLLGALGAIVGFDLFAGIEIQLAAMVFALFAACAGLAWRGALLRTLGNAVVHALGPTLPVQWRPQRCEALSAPVRLGGPVFFATAGFAAPHLLLAWSAL
jgi:prepilin peptidase CpaA